MIDYGDVTQAVFAPRVASNYRFPDPAHIHRLIGQDLAEFPELFQPEQSVSAIPMPQSRRRQFIRRPARRREPMHRVYSATTKAIPRASVTTVLEKIYRN